MKTTLLISESSVQFTLPIFLGDVIDDTID